VNTRKIVGTDSVSSRKRQANLRAGVARRERRDASKLTGPATQQYGVKFLLREFSTDGSCLAFPLVRRYRRREVPRDAMRTTKMKTLPP